MHAEEFIKKTGIRREDSMPEARPNKVRDHSHRFGGLQGVIDRERLHRDPAYAELMRHHALNGTLPREEVVAEETETESA